MDTLRASDRDRDVVVERLHSAYAEGRLAEPELHERLDAALGARTVGELATVTSDLPAPSAARLPRPAATHVRPALLAVWGAWLVAVSINVVIWLAVSLGTGQVAYFWPAWVAGPWGAVLLASTLAGRWGVTQQSARWSSTRPQACRRA